MPKKNKHNITSNVKIHSEEFHEVLGTIPHWILRRGIMLLTLIISIFLIGSAIFKYPDTISTQMILTGMQPATSVVARQSGRLDKLLIYDGQFVKQGDYLAIIENSAVADDVVWLKKFLFDFKSTQLKEIILPPADLQLGAFQNLYSSFYVTLFNYKDFLESKFYKIKLKMLEERLDEYDNFFNTVLRQQQLTTEQLNLQNNEFLRDSLLYIRGLISPEELETSRKNMIQSELALENIYNILQNTQIQRTLLRENILEVGQQFNEINNTYQTDLLTYISKLNTEISEWEQSYVFIAPISGKVNLTNYWTENQFVLAGESGLHILPLEYGELMGKAILPITRSGKVKVGQRVNIRFYNFPDNEYGIVLGQVKSIAFVPSLHTKESAYMVEIELFEGLRTSYGEMLPYLPEMQAQADIITDDLTVLQRILLPLRRVISEQKR